MEILGERYDEQYGFAWDRESDPWQGYEEPEDYPDFDEKDEVLL